MTNKKGFSLLEMTMVVVVISILTFVFQPLFQSTKKDYIYMESCINKVYGDMNNFMYAGATSKAIGSGDSKIFPEQYIITIEDKNTVSMKYKDDTGTPGLYLRDYLTGMSESYCIGNTYTSKFTGDFFTITINKRESVKNGNTQGYTLSGGSSTFTGAIFMLLCHSETDCNEVAKFEIDTRIQSLKKSKCLTINETGGSCIRRDQ